MIPPDEAYRQALLDSASVPRAVLLLYERLMLVLRHAQAACSQSPNTVRHWLSIAYEVLSSLMGIFSQSSDPAYISLYQSHDLLAKKLAQTFQSVENPAQEISEIKETIHGYYLAWKRQLKIRPRQRKINGRLNVRPMPDVE
jgi:flagellin-specific chaperone FliS